jgi:hypothetical protein
MKRILCALSTLSVLSFAASLSTAQQFNPASYYWPARLGPSLHKLEANPLLPVTLTTTEHPISRLASSYRTMLPC